MCHFRVGRLDDVLIHSSGEKTVPPPMESIMMSSPQYASISASHFTLECHIVTHLFPSIMGVTMFGSKHDQAGVLIEPSPLNQIDITDAQQVAHFINLIWCVPYLPSCCTRTDNHFLYLLGQSSARRISVLLRSARYTRR